jgi:hypothetical protein
MVKVFYFCLFVSSLIDCHHGAEPYMEKMGVKASQLNRFEASPVRFEAAELVDKSDMKTFLSHKHAKFNYNERKLGGQNDLVRLFNVMRHLVSNSNQLICQPNVKFVSRLGRPTQARSSLFFFAAWSLSLRLDGGIGRGSRKVQPPIIRLPSNRVRRKMQQDSDV